MKKVLLATSALTLLAGAAAAEMSVGGNARIGVINTGAATVADYRFRVKFSGSGETDGGLTFGASAGIRWDDPAALTGLWGAEVHVSNGMFTLRAGNTAGAIENASGIWNLPIVGYAAQFGSMFAQSALGGFNTSSTTVGAGASQIAVDFALGAANISMSTGSVAGTVDTEIAANFSMGSVNLGIGFDQGNVSGTSATYVTAGFAVGAANITAAYVTSAVGGNHWALGAQTALGSGTGKVWIGDTNQWGIGYSQSLGGGAALGVGVGRTAAGVQQWEAGINFNF
jgi:outer membrane protein OmpU